MRRLLIGLSLVALVAQGASAQIFGGGSSTLRNGLVSFWWLEESSGSRVDSGPAGNTLTSNNSVGQATGKVGSAAQFNSASSRYLSHADNASLSVTSSFTFTAWVYLDSKAASQQIVGKGTNVSAATDEYDLYYSVGADRFSFFVSNGVAYSTVARANTLGSPSTGTWYFIAAWYDASGGGTVNIAVNNGTTDSAVHGGGVWDSTQPFHVGASSTPAIYFDGRIDAVGFWKRVLKAAERTSLYNAGLGRQCPP